MEFVFFVWIWEQTANFALHNIKRLESVYCAVRTESLYKTEKGKGKVIPLQAQCGPRGWLEV